MAHTVKLAQVPSHGGRGGLASTELRIVSLGINEIDVRKSRILDILCKYLVDTVLLIEQYCIIPQNNSLL